MLGYRTFFHVQTPHDEVVPRATEQLYTWLRGKGYDADALRTGQLVPLADGVEALQLDDSPRDDTHSLRVQVTEHKPNGKWVSRLTVHVPRKQEMPWIWLDVDAPDTAVWTGTPGLARSLLEVFPPAFDGEAELGPSPLRVNDDDAEPLLDAVCDPDRRGLVILAGSDDGLPIAPWFELVGRLVKETVGLAATYVLDGVATARFNELIGPDHAVHPGALRTFLPAADPADPQDALRHRVLGARHILRNDEKRIARLLGWKARERAVDAPLPRAVARVGRLLEQRADELLLARFADIQAVSLDERSPAVDVAPSAEPVVVTATPPAVQDPAYLAVINFTSELLGAQELTPTVIGRLEGLARRGLQLEASAAAIDKRLQELRARVEQLELDNYELSERFADEQIEHAIAVEAEKKSLRTVDFLRKELARTGGGAQAWTEPGDLLDECVPRDFQELIRRVDELKGVRFTGDVDVTCELDRHEQTGTWAHKAWDALMALSDYVRVSLSGECSRDVHGYLQFPPSGCQAYPLNKHARDESEEVHGNEKFRVARVLPVPAEVDTAGEVFMGAHFRIAQSGMISPRLHYFDDTKKTGMVYVGYLGRHLPTRRTN
jgi:hypothetical protein